MKFKPKVFLDPIWQVRKTNWFLPGFIPYYDRNFFEGSVPPRQQNYFPSCSVFKKGFASLG